MLDRVTISKLCRYPVKSLGGESLNNTCLFPEGIEGDREWMLIDNDGKFVTQRQFPSLALIQCTRDALRITLHYQDDRVSVHPLNCSKMATVRVWKDLCQALIAPQFVNRWLTEAAGIKRGIRLAYFAKQFKRPIDPARFGYGQTFFADGAPYLIANSSSLKQLNQHLSSQGLKQLEMQRFRPNIVIDGLAAYQEHQVTQLLHEGSGKLIHLWDHCQRCSIVTVNPNKGEADLDGATLLPLMAQSNAMPNNPKAPAFGVNASLAVGDYIELKVGDTLIAEKACQRHQDLKHPSKPQ